jgi:murein DD-endopeptidase MepM/ murein hydrolase activator NlpD
VHAIADGTVRSTRSLGTYGPSVVIEHGGGFYSVYLYLSEITVKDGDPVNRGEVIGRSGGENSDERAHIEFQIRGEVPGGERGQVRALDPITYLRRHR